MNFKSAARVALSCTLLALTTGAIAAVPATGACQLLTKAELDTVTGRPAALEPEEQPIGQGTACHYGEAQLIVLSGPGAMERWNQMMKHFGHEQAPRSPLPGLAPDAYSFFPKPRSQGEDSDAFVVTSAGPNVVVMSVSAPAGKTPQAVLPQAVALAKRVAGKLK
jgi:hypothetical protein